MNKELLTIKEISENTGIKESSIRALIRKGNLKARRIGVPYMIRREDLNNFLDIPNNDVINQKDLEIKRLKDQIQGYKRQYEVIKQLLDTLNGVIKSF